MDIEDVTMLNIHYKRAINIPGGRTVPGPGSVHGIFIGYNKMGNAATEQDAHDIIHKVKTIHRMAAYQSGQIKDLERANAKLAAANQYMQHQLVSADEVRKEVRSLRDENDRANSMISRLREQVCGLKRSLESALECEGHQIRYVQREAMLAKIALRAAKRSLRIERIITTTLALCFTAQVANYFWS